MTTIPTYRPSKKNCKVCGRDMFLYNSLKPYCSAKCANTHKKRGPAKQIKRHPIAKVSKKREMQNMEYVKKRLQYLNLHPTCEVCNQFPAKEIHHKYSGADRARYFLDESTWVAICRGCHNHVHLHPIESKEKGLLK